MSLLLWLVLACTQLKNVNAVEGIMVSPEVVEIGKQVTLLWSYDQAVESTAWPNVTHVATLRITKLYDSGRLNRPFNVVLQPRNPDETKRWKFETGRRQGISAMYPGLTFGKNINPGLGLLFRTAIYIFFLSFSCDDVGTYEFYFSGVNLDIGKGGLEVTKHVYVSPMFNTPTIVLMPPKGPYNLGDYIGLLCQVIGSSDNVRLSYKIVLPGKKKSVRLPMDGSLLHSSLKGKQWPQAPADSGSFPAGGECPNMDYRLFKTNIMFVLKWESLRKSRLYCEAEFENKALHPETFQSVVITDWSRAYVNLSQCNTKSQVTCTGHAMDDGSYGSKSRTIGEVRPGVKTNIVQGLLITVFTGTFCCVIGLALYKHRQNKADAETSQAVLHKEMRAEERSGREAGGVRQSDL